MHRSKSPSGSPRRQPSSISGAGKARCLCRLEINPQHQLGRLCQSNKVSKTVISSVAAFTSDLEPKRLDLAIIIMQTRA
jgi:hypothetical protein